MATLFTFAWTRDPLTYDVDWLDVNAVKTYHAHDLTQAFDYWVLDPAGFNTASMDTDLTVYSHVDAVPVMQGLLADYLRR